jgi:hypothetical protein
MDMVRSPKSIAGAVGLALGNAPYKIRDRTCIRERTLQDRRSRWANKSGIALKPTALINGHGAFPKIDRWSSRSCIRERTLQDRRSRSGYNRGTSLFVNPNPRFFFRSRLSRRFGFFKSRVFLFSGFIWSRTVCLFRLLSGSITTIIAQYEYCRQGNQFSCVKTLLIYHLDSTD